MGIAFPSTVSLMGAFFIAAAAPAAEQMDILPAAPILSFRDIPIEVMDISDSTLPDRDPDIFHGAGLTCGAGQEYYGPLITVLAMPPDILRTYVSDDQGAPLPAGPDEAMSGDFILGADGHVYDIRQGDVLARWIQGTLKSGQHRNSSAFHQSLKDIAKLCLGVS